MGWWGTSQISCHGGARLGPSIGSWCGGTFTLWFASGGRRVRWLLTTMGSTCFSFELKAGGLFFRNRFSFRIRILLIGLLFRNRWSTFFTLGKGEEVMNWWKCVFRTVTSRNSNATKIPFIFCDDSNWMNVPWRRTGICSCRVPNWIGSTGGDTLKEDTRMSSHIRPNHTCRFLLLFSELIVNVVLFVHRWVPEQHRHSPTCSSKMLHKQLPFPTDLEQSSWTVNTYQYSWMLPPYSWTLVAWTPFLVEYTLWCNLCSLLVERTVWGEIHLWENDAREIQTLNDQHEPSPSL